MGSGRCGPDHGDDACIQGSPYCNEDNGWCGSTSAHQNAQASVEYDYCSGECKHLLASPPLRPPTLDPSNPTILATAVNAIIDPPSPLAANTSCYDTVTVHINMHLLFYSVSALLCM